jgi:hypothetical protein
VIEFRLLGKDKKPVGPLYSEACLLQLPAHVEKYHLDSPESWKYIRYSLSKPHQSYGLTSNEKDKTPYDEAYLHQFSKVLFFGDYLKQAFRDGNGLLSVDLDCDVIPQFELTSILTVLRYWDEQYLFASSKFKKNISSNPDWTAKEFMAYFLGVHHSHGFGGGHSLFNSALDMKYKSCSFSSLIQMPETNPKLDRSNPKFFEFSPRKFQFSGKPLFSYYTSDNISLG